MTYSLRPFSSWTAAGLFAVVAFAGCQTSVSEGPASAASAGGTGNTSRGTMVGKEPAPAPIAQKETTPGQSSLSHPAPDQRIDKP